MNQTHTPIQKVAVMHHKLFANRHKKKTEEEKLQREFRGANDNKRQ